MLFKVLRKVKLGDASLKVLAPFARHFTGKSVSMSEIESRALLSAHSPDSHGSAWFPGSFRDASPDADLDIIVPVYNVESYLRDCIRSILEQKTQYRFRAIFIDDGSTDASGRILDEYPPDSRMVVIHQENRGHSGARNTGIAHAASTYLMFVDSDDLLAPGAVQSMLSAAFSRDAALVQGCFSTFQKVGNYHRELNFAASVVENLPLNALPGYLWGKLIRREYFDHLRLPMGYWYEDSIIAQILFPCLLRDQKTVVGLQDVVYYYRDNPQGISRVAQNRPKSIDSFWITSALYEDRRSFSLSNTQFDYETVLDMILLTFERTIHQPRTIQQALMVQWSVFLAEQFSGFHTGRGSFKVLEEAINDKNFSLYSLCCQLL